MTFRTLIVPLLLFTTAAVAQQDRPKALLSADDYPAEAIRLGQQGTVRTRLRISPEGRVTACAIVQSASPSLDAATCRILMERARFTPAKGSTGAAIESEFDTPPIRWVLPKPKPQPPQGLRL